MTARITLSVLVCVAAALTGLLAPGAATAAPVTVQNASATFVRAAPFAPANSVDGVVVNGNNGWAMNGGAETQSPQTFVVQTTAPLTSASGFLQFELPQRYGSNHVINDFRISATTEPNPTTATASWTELSPDYTHASGGLTAAADNRVTRNAGTATGMNWYTVTAPTGSLKNITGFRVEMFPNPKVGAASNGNVVLTEFQVYDAPHEINVALDKPTTGDAWNYPTANGVDFNTGTFTHANNTNPPPNNPYWQVDLEGSYDLSRVEVVARADACCGNRLNGSVLKVLDSAMTPIYTSAPIAGSVGGSSFTFDAGGAGFEDAAHIRVDGNQQYFQFAELRAWHLPTDIPVPLQEATATFQQGNFGNVDQTINADATGGNGMGFYNNRRGNTVIAYETQTDTAGPGMLTLTIDSNLGSGHTLQRFRLSATDADRALFADGNPPNGAEGPPGDTDAAPGTFVLLQPVSATSANGATLTVGPNNIITVSGSPATDTYTITAQSPLGTITGLRLEVLPGPNGNVGFYGPTGNATISEFSVTIAPGGALPEATVRDVNLQNATATYDQGGAFTIGSAIDGIEHGSNGWGVYNGQNQNQTAVFQTTAPLDTGQLVFELNHMLGTTGHKFQQFRLSYTTDANPTATDGSIVWMQLSPSAVSTSLAGSAATIGAGDIIQITGTNGMPDMYQVIVDGDFRDITGFRLEAFTGTNGTLGFSGQNGNVVLTEFNVFAEAVPEPATMVLAGLAISALGGYVRRRRRSV